MTLVNSKYPITGISQVYTQGAHSTHSNEKQETHLVNKYKLSLARVVFSTNMSVQLHTSPLDFCPEVKLTINITLVFPVAHPAQPGKMSYAETVKGASQLLCHTRSMASGIAVLVRIEISQQLSDVLP